jgi:hypothetical protein
MVHDRRILCKNGKLQPSAAVGLIPGRCDESRLCCTIGMKVFHGFDLVLIRGQIHKFIVIYKVSPDYGETPGTFDGTLIGGVVLDATHNFGLGVAVIDHEVLHTLGEVHSRIAWQLNPRKSS